MRKVLRFDIIGLKEAGIESLIFNNNKALLTLQEREYKLDNITTNVRHQQIHIPVHKIGNEVIAENVFALPYLVVKAQLGGEYQGFFSGIIRGENVVEGLEVRCVPHAVPQLEFYLEDHTTPAQYEGTSSALVNNRLYGQYNACERQDITDLSAIARQTPVLETRHFYIEPR